VNQQKIQDNNQINTQANTQRKWRIIYKLRNKELKKRTIKIIWRVRVNLINLIKRKKTLVKAEKKYNGMMAEMWSYSLLLSFLFTLSWKMLDIVERISWNCGEKRHNKMKNLQHICIIFR